MSLHIDWRRYNREDHFEVLREVHYARGSSSGLQELAMSVVPFQKDDNFPGSPTGAVARSLRKLVTRDSNDPEFELASPDLFLPFSATFRSASGFFQNVRYVLQKVSEALQDKLIPAIIWDFLQSQRNSEEVSAIKRGADARTQEYRQEKHIRKESLEQSCWSGQN